MRASGRASLIDRLDAVLPQTQCRQCGYDGCRPYAAAIATGAADIDRCPPGGTAGVVLLAALVGRAPIPLDPTRGAPKPFALAVIDETLCIGCTLCIQACPVDSIAGGAKRVHDVIAELCTGCELCLPPCPVDCIAMIPAGASWSADDAARARLRHQRRARRLERLAAADRSRATLVPASPVTRKQAILNAAIERARRRLLDAPPSGTPRT